MSDTITQNQHKESQPTTAPQLFNHYDGPDPRSIVFIESQLMPSTAPIVQGYDFNEGIDYNKLFMSMKYTGFQATNFGLAVDTVNNMVCYICLLHNTI